jgi:hypothetical protein
MELVTTTNGIHNGGIYDLYLLKRRSHRLLGADWAEAFMRGVELRYEQWREFIDRKQNGEAILPMMTLAQEKDPELQPLIKPSTKATAQRAARIDDPRARRHSSILPQTPHADGNPEAHAGDCPTRDIKSGTQPDLPVRERQEAQAVLWGRRRRRDSLTRNKARRAESRSYLVSAGAGTGICGAF